MYEFATGPLAWISFGIFIATVIRKKKRIAEVPKESNCDSISSQQSEPNDLEDTLWHEAETDIIFKLNESLSLTVQRSKVAQHIVEGVHKFLYARTSIDSDLVFSRTIFSKLRGCIQSVPLIR